MISVYPYFEKHPNDHSDPQPRDTTFRRENCCFIAGRATPAGITRSECQERQGNAAEQVETGKLSWDDGDLGISEWMPRGTFKLCIPRVIASCWAKYLLKSLKSILLSQDICLVHLWSLYSFVFIHYHTFLSQVLTSFGPHWRVLADAPMSHHRPSTFRVNRK